MKFGIACSLHLGVLTADGRRDLSEGDQITGVSLLVGFFGNSTRCSLSINSPKKLRLVTDAAIPIGRAVALQLALQGSYVITAYSSLKQGATHAVDELRSLGTLAGAVEADVA